MAYSCLFNAYSPTMFGDVWRDPLLGAKLNPHEETQRNGLSWRHSQTKLVDIGQDNAE